MTLHHLESYQEPPVPRPGFELPFLVLDETLHHLESYQETPVPSPGFELPFLVLDMTLHHLESSREQLALPGFEPLPPWYFFRTVTPPGISPPAEGERSPSTPPAPLPFQ